MPLHIPSKIRKLSRDQRAAALAEYVTLLLLIGGISIGVIYTFGSEVKDVFDTARIGVDGKASSVTVEGDGEGGSEADGEGYDPGGGLVDGNDILAGCPLPAGTEYFSDNYTVELQRYAMLILPPGDPDNPPDRVGPYPMRAGSLTVMLPSSATWELYQERAERYVFTNSFYWNHTGSFSADGATSSSYQNCSDRSKDGPRAPADSSDGPDTMSIVSAGGNYGSGDDPDTIGYFDENGDVDWHRIEVAEGSGTLRATIIPTLIEGRTPLTSNMSISLVDEAGATPSGVSSVGNTVMSSNLAAGTYYLRAANGSSPYLGMGGYEITAGTVQDTSATYEDAQDIEIGGIWQEDLPDGDIRDMFHLVLPEDREADVVVRVQGLRHRLSIFSMPNDGTGNVETLAAKTDDDVRFLLNHLVDGPAEIFISVGRVGSYAGNYTLTVEEVEDVSPLDYRATELSLGDPLEPALYADGDLDYFTFDNPTEQQILVSMQAYNDQWLLFDVFDSSMNLVASSERAHLSQVLFDKLPADRYFIRAKAAYTGNWGGYSILAEAIDDTPGTSANAAMLPFGSSHAEDIITITDKDFYEFTVPSTQDVLLSTTGASERILMTLYDSEGTEIGSDVPAYPQTQPKILMNQLPAGTYKVSLGTYLYDTTDYELAIGPIVDTPGDFADARAFTLGDTYSEETSTVGDVDAFVFVNDVEQELKIGASASRKFRIRLYDADQNLLYDHGSSTLNKSFETGVLPAGTYYMLMSTRQGYTTDYTIYARPL